MFKDKITVDGIDDESEHMRHEKKEGLRQEEAEEIRRETKGTHKEFGGVF